MFSLFNKNKSIEAVVDNKIVFKNWTLIDLISKKHGTIKIALLKARCSCGKEHERTLKDILKSSGHCVDCGKEELEYIPKKQMAVPIKEESDIVNGMLVGKITNVTRQNGNKIRHYQSKCVLCKGEQLVSVYNQNKACIYCQGDLGKKFNSLTFVGTITFKRKNVTIGKFKCDCGELEIITVSLVRSGKRKMCKNCGAKSFKQKMRMSMLNRYSNNQKLNDKVKSLEKEIEAFKRNNK